MSKNYIIDLKKYKEDNLTHKKEFNSFNDAMTAAENLCNSLRKTSGYIRQWVDIKDNCVILDFGSYTEFVKVYSNNNEEDILEKHTEYMTQLLTLMVVENK